jgi:prophage regulatory protein
MYTENRSESLASQEYFMRLPDVLKLIPVSRSSWYAGIKSGEYPESVKLGLRTAAWKRSDIEALIQKLAGN